MSLRAALFYTSSSKYISLIIQFLATVIIARLLSPEEIGIYSVGAAVIAIAHALRNFGTSTYIIQEKDLTKERLRTAFTLSVGVAWSIAVILWFSADHLSNFYAEHGVRQVLEVMAVNFLLIPLGSITIALLKRDMDFRSIMYIEFAANFIQSTSSIFFAATGFGFISLAWGGLLGTLTTVLATAFIAKSSPVMVPCVSEYKRVLGFSFQSSLASIASEAGHSSPDIVLGRTLGMELTGLFSRAMGYVQLLERLLQDVLRSVMLPYFAGENRSGTNLRAKLYLALENIAAISWFAVGMTAVLAEPMILFLFGPQWGDAVPAAQILCAAIAIRCLSPTISPALVATGQIAVLMRLSLWSTLVKFAMLIVVSRFGLETAAVGFVAAEAVSLVLLMHKTSKLNLFTWREYMTILYKFAPLTLISLLPAVLISNFFGTPTSMGPLSLLLIASAVTSTAVWLGILWSFNLPPKQELSRVVEVIRKKL